MQDREQELIQAFKELEQVAEDMADEGYEVFRGTFWIPYFDRIKAIKQKYNIPE